MDTPLSLDLIESTLVQADLSPSENLVLIAKLREGEGPAEEEGVRELYAAADTLFTRLVLLLEGDGVAPAQAGG